MNTPTHLIEENLPFITPLMVSKIRNLTNGMRLVSIFLHNKQSQTEIWFSFSKIFLHHNHEYFITHVHTQALISENLTLSHWSLKWRREGMLWKVCSYEICSKNIFGLSVSKKLNNPFQVEKVRGFALRQRSCAASGESRRLWWSWLASTE